MCLSLQDGKAALPPRETREGKAASAHASPHTIKQETRLCISKVTRPANDTSCTNHIITNLDLLWVADTPPTRLWNCPARRKPSVDHSLVDCPQEILDLFPAGFLSLFNGIFSLCLLGNHSRLQVARCRMMPLRVAYISLFHSF